jgi:hypothetical protein
MRGWGRNVHRDDPNILVVVVGPWIVVWLVLLPRRMLQVEVLET